jgi:hypothetical protein
MRYIICFFLLFFISSCFNNQQQRLQKTNIANDLYNFEKYKTLDEYTNNYRNYIGKYRSGISQLDIERLAPLPNKPQSVLIERWLPYTQSKRRVIFQGAPPDPVVIKPKVNL